uniref:Battenin n=1 Tax=Oryzias latipes TaxID=8090 RepID=A0A3P9HPS7_ORYLA
MLSAAHDILTKEESKNATISVSERVLTVSLGLQAVLLADILPTLIIKFIAPVFIHKVPYGFLMSPVVSLPPPSFLHCHLPCVVFAGVVFASLGAGLGELSFLSLSHRPTSSVTESAQGLLKFMGPLALVYFAEYFINQGLLELLFFPNFSLSHADQYRWYQTIYQFGVFASRSSLHCVKIRRVWILTLLQVVNAVFLLLAVKFQFLPSAWLLFVIIFYEGLLGGAAYVNTFHFISKETESRHREFAMAASSVGDSFGIALAALAAFFVHQYFCSL